MKFPKGFLFGTATSAHQIEGGNINSDWYQWEKITGHIVDGSTSEIAANSWRKWREDIKLLKKTNQNAYRFSVEWAKVEPREGFFDEAAISHYRKILEELKRNDISSMVTLFHFTLPNWIAKLGGFENKENLSRFLNFARKLALEYGNLVNYWITVNEPNEYIFDSYLTGRYPPGKKDLFPALEVWRNLITLHNGTYKKIKEINHNYQVGHVLAIPSITAAHKRNPVEKILAWASRQIDYERFIANTFPCVDFLGINVYTKLKLVFGWPFLARDKTPISDFGWHIHPEAVYETLKAISRFRKPMFITENGIADESDIYRPKYITAALASLARAVSEGLDVRGYFYWTLMDNFEWADGYTKKFGLFTINRESRRGALVYANLIKKYRHS